MQVVLDPAVVHGATVTAADSTRTLLGRVERVYLAADTGLPTWALVDGAGLGGHRCLVLLSAARLDGTVLRVPYSTAELASAPTTTRAANSPPPTSASSTPTTAGSPPHRRSRQSRGPGVRPRLRPHRLLAARGRRRR